MPATTPEAIKRKINNRKSKKDMGAAQFVHDGKASPARQDNLASAGIAVLVAVGTGLVDIHPVMGVLDRVNR
jgi:hypothetical protein